ncbi:MAG TPA: trypsin-like peptidase domain-containing protein [Actinomycetota bacterium]|nr:trypsin-like peptidase domain-containing protein [Actinomycetota bacterium]
MDNALRHRPLRRRTAALVAAVAAMLLAALASPARAEDPTPAAKALTLATPGIVYISTAADISIRVDQPILNELLGQRRVDGISTRVSSGTGMVLTENGYVATASHVVEFSEDDEDALKVYGANQLFFDKLENIFGGYGPEETPDVRYEMSDPLKNALLQGCYNEEHCKFTIKPKVTVVAPVQVAGNTRSKGLPARVRASTHPDGSDIAILQVIDATTMATVPLATTAGELQSGQSVVALGFPGSAQKILRTGITEPTSAFGHVSSVRSDGTSQVVQVDMKVEGGFSGGPGLDDSGKVIGLLSYTGVENGSRTGVYLRTVDDIRSTLREAGAQPARGELDAIFAQAMEYYWARHYSAALPLYQKVVNLQDGHLLGKKYLRLAQGRAGGPDDVPLPASTADASGRGLVFWALVTLGALVVVALALLALGRRRRRRRPAPPQGLAPMPSWDDGRPDLDAPDDLQRDPAPPGDEAAPSGPLESGVGPTRAMDARDVPTNSQAPVRTDVLVQDQQVPARGFCPYCGSRLVPEARFCSGCGQAQ